MELTDAIWNGKKGKIHHSAVTFNSLLPLPISYLIDHTGIDICPILPLQGIAVNEIAVPPRNLSATFFSDRIEDVDNVTSAAMYAALLSEGCLNSTGYLVENPR